MPQVVPKFVVVAQACALACALVFAGASQVEAADPIRVMLLDGESGGPYHDWRTTTPILKKELQETGLFQVDVVTAPKSGGDFSHFQPDFSSYRAIVSNLDSQEWPVSLQYIFEQYVRNGGGSLWFTPRTMPFPAGLATTR